MASGGACKLSQFFLHLRDSVCSLKCIRLRKRAISSSLSQYNAARTASERYGAAAHTGCSRAALAGDYNDQAAKAAISVAERVETYSENLTLVTLHKSGLRPSTTLFQRHGAVSNIALKCSDAKTRAMKVARKRNDRKSPSNQAGVQLFQPLFCGAQERWRSLLDTRSQAHQQSALQASVRDDFAGTDPCADSPRGLVASVDLRMRTFTFR